MSTLQEIDHLMTLTTNGIKTYETATEAYAEELREWMNTPVGSVYGKPWWGTIIGQFKHEPTNQSHIQVAIQNRMYQKISEDLPNLQIQGISFAEETGEIDAGFLTIQLPEGTITVSTATED
jgi:hypothetical protein